MPKITDFWRRLRRAWRAFWLALRSMRQWIELDDIPVSLTEEFIMNPGGLPEKIRTWRYYRIEYGGCNECCFKETPIFLPPRADAYIFDLLFEFWQTPEADIRRQGDILADIFNIMLGVR